MNSAVSAGIKPWAACLVGLLLAGTHHHSAAQAPSLAQLTPSVTVTQPVQAPASGRLTDLFFTAGERVQRGQILAKLLRSDGSPAYLLAPSPGRIGAAQQHLGDWLAVHATLAVIETKVTR